MCGALSRLGSLFDNGTLSDDGSLMHCGTLTGGGSLGRNGTLLGDGSLTNNPLLNRGALPDCGSLSVTEASSVALCNGRGQGW